MQKKGALGPASCVFQQIERATCKREGGIVTLPSSPGLAHSHQKKRAMATNCQGASFMPVTGRPLVKRRTGKDDGRPSGHHETVKVLGDMRPDLRSLHSRALEAELIRQQNARIMDLPGKMLTG